MRPAIGVTLVLCVCLSCSSGVQQRQESAGKAAQTSSKSNQGASKESRIVKLDSSALADGGVQTVQVHMATIPASFKATGPIALNEESTAHVGTYVDGRVTEVNARVGDYVHKGQVLARMHSHTVHETRGALDSAREEVARQQEAVDYRKRMLERMKRLLALKSASQQEVERAHTELTTAETDLRNAQINVGKETAHLSDILRLPDSDLRNITEETERPPIVAPIDGQVVDRKITVGTVLEPGGEAFTISNLASVWMNAAIAEADIGKVQVGLPVVVRTQAYPDESFPGRITYLGAELDAQTRTLPARALIPNKTRKLHAGMFAEAEIQQRSGRRTLLIPEDAIQDLNGGPVVFRRKDPGTFEPQPVTVADRRNGRAEISSGLHEGDVIVSRGSFVVKSELLKSRIGE